MKSKAARCGNTPCNWCDRDDWPCRGCAGTGWWNPQRPLREPSGLIDWTRTEEPCRMCGNTGKEHNPLAETAPPLAL